MCWVLKHIGIRCNEKPDSVAKSALDLPHVMVVVPYSGFKHQINQYIISTWQDVGNGNKLHCQTSQCSMTDVTKAVVCAILYGMMHIKEPLLLIGKSSPCGGGGFLSRYLSGPLPYG